jgi:hypothetical protein
VSETSIPVGYSGKGFMTRPKLELYTVAAFSLICIGVAVCLFGGLEQAFRSNPIFNSLILVILVVGVGSSVRQLLRVDQSARWMAERMRSPQITQPVPYLLKPITSLVCSASPQPTCGTLSLRAMLDGVFGRLDDSREVTRYLMNVLILLGLLGTFWGLLQTVGGIGAVIGGLSLGEGDVKAVFDTFKSGLQKPLYGMGISFSASLFGLASSMVLGFMDLQAGRAQNVFCSELEEILSSKEPPFEPAAGGDYASLKYPMSAVGGGYQDAVVTGLADQLDKLQRTLRQQMEQRATEQAITRTLQEVLAALDDHLKSQHALLSKMVGYQQEVAPIYGRLAEIISSASVGSLEQHARSIDLSVKEFSRHVAVSSEIQTEELRGELRVIARLLAGPKPGETELLAG